MKLRFLEKIFTGKKETRPIGSIPCQDGGYICGLVLADGSVQGDKYHEGKLIASGKFINGKLNGQGKRYHDGRIMCEGNFVDNHLSGKGKRYSHLGHLVYEGYFASIPDNSGSVCHGEGREFHYQTGALLYEGDFNNNRWSGRGKEYYPNGQLRYQGEFRNSSWHGQGEYFDIEGNLVYAGDFVGVSPRLSSDNQNS